MKAPAKPATTPKDLEALIDRFIRQADKTAYMASQLSGDKNLKEILALDDASLCALTASCITRLEPIYKKHLLWADSNNTSYNKSPWRAQGGDALTLALQRIFLKKLPFTAPQLRIFADVLRGDLNGWVKADGLISALSRGVETGTLTDLKLAQQVLKHLIKNQVRPNDKNVAKLAAALKNVDPAAAATESSLLPLSPLESLLLSRDKLKPSTTTSLTDRLLNVLSLPPETEPKGVASFDPKPFGKHANIINTINKILTAQPLRYQDDALKKIKTELAIISAGGVPAVALTAAALSAMSFRPIKHSFDDQRSERYHNGRTALLHVIPAALQAANKSSPESLSDLCHALSRFRGVEYESMAWPDITAALARLAANLDLKKSDLPLNLLRLRERISRAEHSHNRAAVQSFDEAFHIGRGLPIDLGEPWSDRVYTDLRSLKPAAQSDWLKVLETCILANSAQPTAKWLKQIDDALSPLKPADIQTRLSTWLPLAGKNRPSLPGGKIEGRDSSVPSERNADILRGLAFILSRFDTPRSAKALGDLAMSGYKMVPGIGARCPKPATASVWALSQLKNPEALSQLSRIRQLVKFGTAKKVLDTALNKLAKELNVSTDELHEMAAPDFGLDHDGSLREQAGDYTLELRIDGGSADVRILDENNKEPKTTPDALKKDATLKQLKLLAADIDKMLPAQKDRLERLYHDQRQWPAATWRARYIDHALVGTLGRRLIWNFTRGKSTTSAIWHDDLFINSAGKGIEVADDDAVSLWHPALAPAKETTAWRTFLESKEIKQPFKQAHREVYLLTDAERRTRTYSNRFAAHIIKQNQLNALCQNRGWKHTLYVMDSGDPPTLHLPKHDLWAHFLVQPIGDDYFGNAGAYSYLQTDQVAFTRTPRGENIPLSDIPPLAFSEVMRDVDLFVGVCSVGNNPDWQDGGPEGRYRQYWWDYGFGALTGSGDSRKKLLTRLIPKLKIAKACSLDGRFLKVEGKRRTYKIHLGSGNILMEPNDQYLCIVPGRDQDSKVFLPFEGDRVLAIILSKAFMLADDDKITDSSISSQISRKK